MNILKNYITQIIPLTILFLLVYLIIRILTIKKHPFDGLKKELIRIGFIVYISILLGITIVPRWRILPYEDGTKKLEIITEYESQTWNLIPFQNIIATVLGQGTHSSAGAKINLFGNILLTIPLGFFLHRCLRNNRCSLAMTIAITLCVCIVIETIQFFIGRTSDIDDIILNTIGSFLGYYFYSLFLKRPDQ